MAKTCKNCGREIRYKASIQRWDHIDTNYDACSPTFTSNPLSGKRAEPV